MTIYERLLAACCAESTVDIERHAARILTVVCAAKRGEDAPDREDSA